MIEKIAMTEKKIEFRNVSFAYTDEKSSVLSHLNCYFLQNKLNLLLGPSGCGKTTALYLLNGIIPSAIEGVASGEIFINGDNVLGKQPKEMAQKVGFVFQDPESQFCTFNVEDEIAFGLENLATEPSEISRRITAALEMVGMSGFEKATLSELSGGQKQKIAIAVVLAMVPDIIILDEPTANLDPESSNEIFALMASLVNEHQKTLIVVEHKLDGLMDKVEHVVVMDASGNAHLMGNPVTVIARLLYHPEDSRIRVFLPEHLLILQDIFYYNQIDPFMQTLREKLFLEALEETSPVPLTSPDYAVEILKTILDHYGVPEFISQAKALASSSPVLELQNVQYAYNQAGNRKKLQKKGTASIDKVLEKTLRKVDLTVMPGDFIAIVGPNGAGKSTLLNVVLKVLEDFEGKIFFSGQSLTAIAKPELYRQLGLVFQNPEWQFISHTLKDELLYSLKAVPLTEEEKTVKIREVLASFHLSADMEKSPFLLSQGQKRRLSVAAMLLTGQKMLFLDEPTYGQDYENQLKLMDLMRRLNQKGVTIVLVTHNMSLVADYVDKVNLLVQGKILFSGTPADLFQLKDLIKAGRLDKPVTLKLCEKLRLFYPSFPLLCSREKLTKLFCAQVSAKKGKPGGKPVEKVGQ